MTIAYETMALGNNANDVMNRAAEIAVATDQDWDNEAPFYTFEDDSVLLVSGPQCNVFADIESAKAALQQ